KAPAAIGSVVDPTRHDGRVIRAADGCLERIVERKDATPEMRVGVHEFNVGLYCFDGSKLVEELGTVGDDNNAGEYYLTDVFLHLKPVTVVTLDDPREAMGVKDRVRLATATEILRRRLLDNLMLGGVTIVDPNSTFIDAGVVIGHDTDLGADANIGAGTITANFDGTKKNRTEIGDGAFVGVDTMLVAPVKVGKGARTGAGSVVTKDVPDGATAVGVPARVVRTKQVS